MRRLRRQVRELPLSLDELLAERLHLGTAQAHRWVAHSRRKPDRCVEVAQSQPGAGAQLQAERAVQSLYRLPNRSREARLARLHAKRRQRPLSPLGRLPAASMLLLQALPMQTSERPHPAMTLLVPRRRNDLEAPHRRLSPKKSSRSRA
jgi:hypothetical protein